MAKNSRIHGSIFAEEIALRVHLLELFDGSLSRRCRAMVFAVSRIDGLIGTLKRGPDLLAPLDAYLFRIIETPRVGGTTAVSYVSIKSRSIVYLCATKYVKPNGAYGLNDSNPCPSSAIGAGRLAVLQLGLVPLLDSASSSTRKALGAPTGVCPNCWRVRIVVSFSDSSVPR